jgi:hypothetical protein
MGVGIAHSGPRVLNGKANPMKQRQKKVSLFDWLAADNKPDYLGYRRLDPVRVRLAMAIMREADEERARKAVRK